MGILGAVCVAVLLSPFGFLLWALTGEVFGLWLALILGGLMGGMGGFGRPFVETFSDPEFAQPDETSTGELLVDLYVKSWVPGLSLLESWAKKDFSRARPGRWKRGLIGALAMGSLGTVLGLMLCSGPGPRAGVEWQGFLFVVGLSVAIGAVAGTLTDSR